MFFAGPNCHSDSNPNSRHDGYPVAGACAYANRNSRP